MRRGCGNLTHISHQKLFPKYSRRPKRLLIRVPFRIWPSWGSEQASALRASSRPLYSPGPAHSLPALEGKPTPTLRSQGHLGLQTGRGLCLWHWRAEPCVSRPSRRPASSVGSPIPIPIETFVSACDLFLGVWKWRRGRGLHSQPCLWSPRTLPSHGEGRDFSEPPGVPRQGGRPPTASPRGQSPDPISGELGTEPLSPARPSGAFFGAPRPLKGQLSAASLARRPSRRRPPNSAATEPPSNLPRWA